MTAKTKKILAFLLLLMYRSQHPANGSFRSKFANQLAEEYHIRAVLNLSDSDSSLNAYFRKNKISSTYYYRTLYSNGKVYTANLSQKHTSSSYRKKVANGLKFLAKNKGPYLIHCEVGRDRTGFVILLLECLMGSSYDAMLSDYAISYVNVNHYSQEKARQKAISCLNFLPGRRIQLHDGKEQEHKLASGGSGPACYELHDQRRNDLR